MNKNQKLNYVRLLETLNKLGLDMAEVDTLIKCERTLGRWSELECGDGNDYASWAIERDETTDKPFMVTHPHKGDVRRVAVADREKGALKRAAAIATAHGLTIYHQTDPRGCSLYIIRPGDIPEGSDVTGSYSNGIAVCI